MKPLFIPLKAKYFDAFESGEKTTEYRKLGKGFNPSTCVLGRPVTLSRGYGKSRRLSGSIKNVEVKWMDSPEWIEVYKEPGKAIAIEIELQNVGAVYHGDCRQIVPSIGEFDFVFADPPFNIGQDYSGYDDKMEKFEFDDFVQQWIDVCWDACRGVMALHGNDDMAEQYLFHARRKGMKRIAWVNWHYRFGQCNRSNWIDSRCHCLIFSKNEKYKWNPDSVLVESDRVQYGDKRVNETDNGGKRVPFSTWGIPSDGPFWSRVVGNSKERIPECPNQLPELYLKRLILAYTDRGDRVLDPFGGSGTTAVVASSLGRDYATVDVSQKNVDVIRARIKKGMVRNGQSSNEV